MPESTLKTAGLQQKKHKKQLTLSIVTNNIPTLHHRPLLKKAPYFWDTQTINEQILEKIELKDYRQFDRKSIMMYVFHKDLFTTDFEMSNNVELSESDKSFIAKLYPK